MTAITGTFRRWWLVAGVVLLWQGVASLGLVNPLLLPAPGDLAYRFLQEPAAFLLPLLGTVTTAATGLVTGVVAGVAVASLVWLLPWTGGVVTPFALVMRSVPFVALIPVLTRVIGYGDGTATIICALVSFFPTFVLVSTGLREIPPGGTDLFTVAGASRLDRYRRLALPASLPALATAFRIASASSIAAALVAEFLMGTPGLALLLTDALNAFDITRVWAGSACAALVGIAVYLLAGWIESKVIDRWR